MTKYICDKCGKPQYSSDSKQNGSKCIYCDGKVGCENNNDVYKSEKEGESK